MSTDPDKRTFVSDRIRMEMGLFAKCVEDMLEFHDKVRTVRFVGMGEPLLHSGIHTMVKLVRDSGMTDRIELLTNGSLLSPRKSDALISAGLSSLIVSIQGMGDDKYQKITGVSPILDTIIQNIAYFYANRGKCHVYVKIVDYALDSKAEEERFYHTFESICDTIAVEHVVPIMPGVDYTNIPCDKESTQFGLKVGETEICPQPYFTMQINPDGKVVPCYQINYPSILGDINKENLVDIWSHGFKYFQYSMTFGRNKLKVCDQCEFVRYRAFPEDGLAGSAERLRLLYR